MGSQDGIGAADRDQPYTFGLVRPTTEWTYPFTPRQYCKLLVLKSRVSEERYVAQLERMAAVVGSRRIKL